jgi:hypothetical protein
MTAAVLRRDRPSQLLFLAIALLPVAACHHAGHGQAKDQAIPIGTDTRGDATPPGANSAAGGTNSPAALAASTMTRNADATDRDGFQPLASQAVKDAIHRALNAGTAQRWQDGGFSGYAVPSQTTDAHGCRAVRYTVDQQPAATYPVITACDAGRAQ